MQGHGADDMQQDQDQEYGSDDHGGDDPATAGPRLWLIFLLGMLVFLARLEANW